MKNPIVEVAGVAVELCETGALEKDIRKRYARFLTDRAADFAITVKPCTGHDPDAMPTLTRVAPDRYTVVYGGLRGTLDLASRRGEAEVPDSVYVVDSLLRISMTLLLLPRRGLLLHSSGVKRGSDVLVCFGPSGVGKTTVAKSVPLGDVLCDEVMALTVSQDGRVTAHGTPFHGELGICAPGSGPLAALCRLHQARDERLTPLSSATATRELLAATLFFCREPDLAEHLLDLAAAVCNGRTFSLEFALTTHVPDYVFAHLRRDADEAQPPTARPPARG